MDPDIKLQGLSIWVLNREFPQSTNGWDEEWLFVRATMMGKASSVTTEGMILMTTDFMRFRDELETMHATLTGTAALSGYEPDLKLTLTAHSRGGVSGVVEITPDQLTENHHFEFGIDQSYLPSLVASCDAILERFPVIGNPPA